MVRESSSVEKISVVGKENPIFAKGCGHDVLVRMARQPYFADKLGVPSEASKQRDNFFAETLIDEKPRTLPLLVQDRIDFRFAERRMALPRHEPKLRTRRAAIALCRRGMTLPFRDAFRR